MSEPSARRAVRLLARVELRRGLVALVVFGLCAGVLGGLVAGSAGLARRTSSAFDRLATETAAEDARVNVFTEEPADVDHLRDLPGVVDARVVSIGVGRLEGPDVVYLGMLSAAPSDSVLFAPIVVDGRMPADDAPDEVVITERLGRQNGIEVGDRLPVSMLTREETAQFDTGFGDPDGPFVDLEVTGIIRVLPGVMDSSPVLTSPAFATAYGEVARAGEIVMVDLDDVATSRDALVAEVAGMNARAAQAAGRSEFLSFDVEFAAVARQQYDGAAGMLVVGLVAFAVVGASAGVFAIGQALLRREAANADAQRIEAALGLEARDRVAIRVLPMVPAAALAAAVTLVLGLVAARLDPPGSMAAIEPHPGLLVDWAPILLSAVGAGLVLLVLAAVAARSAGHPRRVDRVPGLAATRLVSGTGNPTVAASLAFALASGRGDRNLPARTAIVTTVLGVTALVGALTFTASLDALQERPASWGWPGPFSVVDVTPEIEAALRDDPRVAAVGLVESSSGVLGGRGVMVSSTMDRVGTVDWTVIEGRAPSADDEIALGTRLAEDLGAGVGDEVVGTDAGGQEVALDVVGIMLLPPFDTGPLGDGAVATAEGREILGHSDSLREAVVVPVEGVDSDALIEELSARWEVFVADAPPEVRNLLDLGSLPLLLGLFVAVVGMVAMANAVMIAIRRHRRDLEVLRAIGFVRGQVRGVIVGMAVTTAAIGVVLGVPLGVAVGRFVWWAAAADAGLGTSIDVPLVSILSTVAAVSLAAALIGVVPGLLGARGRASVALPIE